jgi:hypothetical protein
LTLPTSVHDTVVVGLVGNGPAGVQELELTGDPLRMSVML